MSPLAWMGKNCHDHIMSTPRSRLMAAAGMVGTVERALTISLQIAAETAGQVAQRRIPRRLERA
jgi:hypothetical protein